MTLPRLDIEKVLRLLDPEGPISQRLKHFELRHEQRQMLSHLIEAFNKGAVALLEAGTGTGKSMAYLIPALLAAAIWKERVVISTHTIALQEQLVNKDLPLLLEALDLDLKVTLVKGMHNYVCLRKFDDILFEKQLLPIDQQELLSKTEHASQNGIGSRAELPFNLPPHLWEMVSAEYETCNSAECPHFSRCFYMQARKNALDAQLLIVNHHLLFADLTARAETQKYNETALLPAYNYLICDEAHHLESIASDFFAAETSRLQLLKNLSKLTSEKHGKAHGKLPLLKEKVQTHFQGDFSRSISHLLNILTIDLPALRRDLLKVLSDTFEVIERFQNGHGIQEEQKLRILNHHYASKLWQETLQPQTLALASILKRYSLEISRLEGTIKDLDHERIQEACKSLLFDIKAYGKRLAQDAEYLEVFIKEPSAPGSIRWIESTTTKNGMNISCVDAALNIAEKLRNYLFNPFKTVILLSATLTTEGNFKFLRERMGLKSETLEGRPLIEAAYNSPFDFKKQALLIIPKDTPSPTDTSFLPKAQQMMWEAIQASHGNAFILFTSYGMLKECYQALEQKLKAERYFPLKQGDEGRQQLLRKFVENDRSVLFGTDSFWEGVDVAGEALRLVIIAKLPFKVPSDPILQARSEEILKRGGDPFYEMQLPEAAIKFKQGFGRLIRNKKDRGCILCLDSRLINKAYGQYFLKTLPPCGQAVIPSSEIMSTMRAFYKQTYYMTK